MSTDPMETLRAHGWRQRTKKPECFVRRIFGAPQALYLHSSGEWHEMRWNGKVSSWGCIDLARIVAILCPPEMQALEAARAWKSPSECYEPIMEAVR